MAEVGLSLVGEVKSRTGLKRVFQSIRHEIDEARGRPDLTELYCKAGDIIALTNTPSWQDQWGTEAARLRGLARKEFVTTVRKINRRARHLGTEADYDPRWER